MNQNETEKQNSFIVSKTSDIPLPPEDLLSHIDRIMINAGDHPNKGKYTEKLIINGKEYQASSLLPLHMKPFYGYSKEPLAKKTMCHTMTIMHHYPNCHDWKDINSMNFIEFIEDNSTVIKNKEIKPGDICLITINYTNPPKGILKRRILHTCIFITPDLVFSKNGKGSSVPFLLQKSSDILKKYGATNPDAVNKIEARRFN